MSKVKSVEVCDLKVGDVIETEAHTFTRITKIAKAWAGCVWIYTLEKGSGIDDGVYALTDTVFIEERNDE